jgi:hypothetical protein
MATSITLVSTSPSAARLFLVSDDNSPVTLSRTGVPGATLVALAQLTAGPLKALLARTADWSQVLTSARIECRVGLSAGGGTHLAFPVAAAVARGFSVTTSADAITFTPSINAAASEVSVDLVFKHSLTR